MNSTRRVRHELKVWGRLRYDSILPLWGVANNLGTTSQWFAHGLTIYLER